MARPKSSKSKTPTKHDALDEFVDHVRGKGDRNVGLVIKETFDLKTVSTEKLNAAIELMETDHRFVLTGKGIDATVRMAGESGEPEDLTEEARARLEDQQLDQAQREMDPSAREAFASPLIEVEGEPIVVIATMDCRTPPATGEAAPVPTIGEALEQQQAETAKTDDAPDIDSTHQAVDPVQAQRDADAARAKRDKEENEKRIASGIEALDNAIANITADLKEKKDRRKALHSELMASILGHTQTSLEPGEGLDGDEINPDETPVAKAARGEVPPIVEPNGLGLIRGMGANSATAGKLETDCPYSREENAKERSMWLDGYRETMREDKSERPAEVQGLFRDALVDAMITNSLGLLEPGATTPKVKTVKFDERPHLVVGMCSADENPGAIERWALVPLFTRGEWAETFAEDFGPAIRDADASDEAKAIRQKRGVDTGRMVKSGRSVLVVGPLSRLTVATVKPVEQPKF